METWSTIAAQAAVAGMDRDLAIRFGSYRMPVDDQQDVIALHLVSREEPAS